LANVTISSGTSNLATTAITNGTSNVTIASSGGNIAMATNGTTAVTIDTSQQVGIGTTSPVTKLTLAGNFAFSGNQSFNWNLYSSSGDKFIANGYAVQTYYDPSVGILRWLTSSASNSGGAGAAATMVDRVAIDSSGNLLVGTTSGSSNTISSGNGYALYVAQTTTNNSVMRLDGAYSSGTINLIAFYAASTYRGAIQFNGTAVLYTTSSDYRLKENVVPMTGALATVAQLKPVKYKWKADGSDGQGFIAHELAEVAPDCVTGEKDAVDADGNPVYQGIDTSFLVATLTSAIQELKAIVDAQATRIASLEAKVGA